MSTRFFLLIAFVCNALWSKAQTNNAFLANYLYNYHYINPAYIGKNERTTVGIASRYQWVGFDGSPKTYALNAFSNIKSLDEKVAVGGILINDKIGPENNFYVTADLAYHLFFDEAILSFGIRSGISSFSINLSSLELNDYSDNRLVGNTQKVVPVIGTGLYFYTHNYFIGFSSPQLIQYELNTLSNTQSRVKRVYQFAGGHIGDINRNMALKLTAFVEYSKEQPLEAAIAPSLLIQEKLWLGTFLRSSKNIGFMTQWVSSNLLSLGYIFEYPLGISNNISFYGTHELTLSLRFDNKVDKVMNIEIHKKSHKRKHWKSRHF